VTVNVGEMRLPDCAFCLFGMGNRWKILYKQGRLLDPMTGEPIRQWDTSSDEIHPMEYTVTVNMRGGGVVTIREDENGVWLEENKKVVCSIDRWRQYHRTM
jgi:hypothetical protein